MNSTTTTNCIFFNPVDINPGFGMDDYEYASSTCTGVTIVQSTSSNLFAPSIITSTTSTTSVPVYAYYTSGEVLIALMLFLILCLELFKIVIQNLDKIKWKRTWLGYNGGDVEIKYEP